MRAEHAEAVVKWRAGEAARKRANEAARVKWRAEVAAWERERMLAKEEKRRPGWTKPVMTGRILKGLPRPKLDLQDEEEDDDENEDDEDEDGDER